jgi:hypothetical protein
VVGGTLGTSGVDDVVPGVPLAVVGDGTGADGVLGDGVRCVGLLLVVGVAGTGVVRGAVVRACVRGAGCTGAGRGVVTPVVAVPVSVGCTVRYSAPIARNSTDRTTVDVRARPR